MPIAEWMKVCKPPRLRLTAQHCVETGTRSRDISNGFRKNQVRKTSEAETGVSNNEHFPPAEPKQIMDVPVPPCPFHSWDAEAGTVGTL